MWHRGEWCGADSCCANDHAPHPLQCSECLGRAEWVLHSWLCVLQCCSGPAALQQPLCQVSLDRKTGLHRCAQSRLLRHGTSGLSERLCAGQVWSDDGSVYTTYIRTYTHTYVDTYVLTYVCYCVYALYSNYMFIYHRTSLAKNLG